MPVISHGGDPTLGSSGLLSVDATDLQLTDSAGNPTGPVIPDNQAFNVSMVFVLDGTMAMNLAADPNVQFTITYTFGPRGGGAPTPLTVGPTPITSATATGLQPPFVYGAPDTTANVPVGTLADGLYDLSASVTFPSAVAGAPPYNMAAFADFELIDIFQP